MYSKINEFTFNGQKVTLVKTDEFERFAKAKGNREPLARNVRRLTDSIRTNQLFTSVIVNERWEIIDGQHRKEAFQTLKRPLLIHIVQGLKDSDISTYNVNMHNWNQDDYLKYFIDHNKNEYTTYKEFKERTGFGHAVVRSLLSGHSASGNAGDGEKQANSVQTFENGNFQATSEKYAYTLAGFILDIDFKHKTNQNFIGAFQFVYDYFLESNEHEYDHNRMKRAFKLYGRDYEAKPKKVFEFKMDLQKLYNFKKRSDHIQFITAEEMAQNWAS